jgi:hypothetical protein
MLQKYYFLGPVLKTPLAPQVSAARNRHPTLLISTNQHSFEKWRGRF